MNPLVVIMIGHILIVPLAGCECDDGSSTVRGSSKTLVFPCQVQKSHNTERDNMLCVPPLIKVIISIPLHEIVYKCVRLCIKVCVSYLCMC